MERAGISLFALGIVALLGLAGCAPQEQPQEQEPGVVGDDENVTGEPIIGGDQDILDQDQEVEDAGILVMALTASRATGLADFERLDAEIGGVMVFHEEE